MRDYGDPEEGTDLEEFEESRPELPTNDSGIGSSSGGQSSGNPYLDRTCEDYKVGIVCALPKELLAIRALFDDVNPDDIIIPERDSNYYALGCIGRHNVVAACLPSREYGISAATDVIIHMMRTFPVEFCLLVGIGGGVPSEKKYIRLGDVVVSHPDGIYPGVVQYDLGKAREWNVFELVGGLGRPPPFILKAITKLESDTNRSCQPLQMKAYINQIARVDSLYQHPGREFDQLFPAGSRHKSNRTTCSDCGDGEIREDRESTDPKVHYGVIASGNKLIKDAQLRDELGAAYNAICVEMEAAGTMNRVACLVIRGICDYADSHKNDVWQEYAAATAATYAKYLLSVVRNNQVLDRSLMMPADSSGPIKRRRTVTSLPPPKKLRPS
ncbi:hypothetical protein H072_8921 [Dactylellina haptotyla CBS 200.50]|uniref:Nucleoside phosphorylase domain-containing protein n=1 Tax=Dactylellina haptotyla (strain CBS 200.50) TaxID=1284197 RepID=S8A3V3_DACHA|nr:hypothetical protein H072_8921 [Dactylellina haptotyla CBS 200.50]